MEYQSSEVRALEQAACNLVAVLHLVLWSGSLAKRIGLPSPLGMNGGLHISLPKHVGLVNSVTIHPAGWPKGSRIYATFIRASLPGAGWKLFEGGEIYADHLPQEHCVPGSYLRFKPSEQSGGLGITFQAFGDWEGDYLKSAYKDLLGSLKADLAAISKE